MLNVVWIVCVGELDFFGRCDPAKSPWGDQPDAPPPVHVTFVDWIPGICSLLGYLVINLIDKNRIRGDEGLGDLRAVWRALFIGFALMAGGLDVL